MVLGGRKKKVATKKKVKMPANIKVAKTLGDYKDIVGGERDRIVVVRFFAPWCKVRTLLVQNRLLYCILLERRLACGVEVVRGEPMMGDELPACHGAIPSEIGSLAFEITRFPGCRKFCMLQGHTGFLRDCTTATLLCIFETLRVLRHHSRVP